MDIDSFHALTQWIMQETGLDEAAAGEYAAQIGDTLEVTDDGLWTATVDGTKISIRPPNQ